MSKSYKVGFFILLSLLLMALIAPCLSPYSHDGIALALKNQPPSFRFWFGTDDLGRDLFTRVWMGARVSFFIAAAAACIDLFIGVIWGTLAAYKGGLIDEILMRCADILFALPYILVVILLTVFIGPGLHTIILAISLIGWIPMARVIRGQLLFLKQQEFILASKGLGIGMWGIIVKDLVPNLYGTMLATVTITIPTAIFTEALLSFIGLGIPPPLASLGSLISEGIGALQYYPWRLFFPAGVLSMTLLSFNLLSDDFF